MNLTFPIILKVITSFYDKATNDILIGYHFRFVKDFDEHLPRIASFWQLQLTGKIDSRDQLPFKLLDVHKPLKMNKGEVHRWVLLFDKTLDEFIVSRTISTEDKVYWMEKVEIFKKKILTLC